MSASPPLRIAATYEDLRQLGPWLHDHGMAPEMEARVGEIELAVHEVAMNIVDHAYDDHTRPNGKITISAETTDSAMTVRLTDQGAEFGDWPDAPDPNSPQVRGYGMMIVEQIVSSISHARVGDENIWTLTFGPRR